jgi:hypothetical protein
VQPKQVLRGPAEGGGLVTPTDQEAAAILDCLLPVIDFDPVRAPLAEHGEASAVVGGDAAAER